jgi:hypothetical protein
MPLRQALLQNIGGTLLFNPTEAGTITSAQLDIYDRLGVDQVPAVTPTIVQAEGSAPAQLSYGLGGDNVLTQNLQENLRALWTYVIAGTTYRRNTTFDIELSLIYPTLVTPAHLYARYPILENRDFLGAVGSQTTVIATAWEDLLQRLRGFGKNPNRFIDPYGLEPAHGALAASYIAKNYRPGKTTDWQQWAEERAAESDRLLRQSLSNFAWYDKTQTLMPSYDDEHMGTRDVRLIR